MRRPRRGRQVGVVVSTQLTTMSEEEVQGQELQRVTNLISTNEPEQSKLVQDKFQNATQIYKLIGARFLSRPIFLLRNLSYVKSASRRRCRPRSKDDKFSVDSMLSNLPVSRMDQVKLIRVLNFRDGRSWPPSTMARVDLQIIRICGEDDQILNKTFASSLQVPVNNNNNKVQLTSNKARKSTPRPPPPVLTVRKNSLHAVNGDGEIVQSIRLAVRFSIMSNLERKQCANNVKENNDEAITQQCNNNNSQQTEAKESKTVYVGVLPIYDRKRGVDILQEGDCDLEIPLHREIPKDRILVEKSVENSHQVCLQPAPARAQEYLLGKGIRTGCHAKISIALRTREKGISDVAKIVPPLLEYSILRESPGTSQSTVSTESRNDVQCPWCSINCHVVDSLFIHLESCHSLFKFNFWKIQNGARISVTINDPAESPAMEGIRSFLYKTNKHKLAQSVGVNEENMEQSSADFVEVNGSRKRVKCLKCSKRFTRKSTMMVHLNNVHFKIRHPCRQPGCGKSFTLRCGLLYHQKLANHKVLPSLDESTSNAPSLPSSFSGPMKIIHLPNKKFKCPKCSRRFACSSNMRAHLNNVHFKIRHPCPYSGCGKSYSLRSRLSHHQKLVNHKVMPQSMPSLDQASQNAPSLPSSSSGFVMNKKFKCPKCKQRFMTKGSVMMHLNHIHSKKISHPCPHPGCYVSYAIKGFLARHQRLVHPKPLTQSMPSLDQSSQNTPGSLSSSLVQDPKLSLKTHVKIIDLQTKTVQCPKCNQRFKSRGSMMMHLQKIHINSRNKCPHPGCNATYRHKGNLLKHQARGHRGEVLLPGLEQSVQNVSPSSSVFKMQTCYFCQKNIVPHNLDFHLLRHTGEIKRKVLRCKKCNKRFHQRRDLAQHKLLSHNTLNRKIFKCKVQTCGQVFTLATARNTHMNIKHSDRKYNCPKCSEIFATSQNMRIHHESIHLKIRHPCPHPNCDKTFSQKGQISRHLKSSHFNPI